MGAPRCWAPCPGLPAGKSVFLAPGLVPAAAGWTRAGKGSAAVPSQPQARLGFYSGGLFGWIPSAFSA